MMSICLMMFGVYAASNPSVSISGQVSYSIHDAKVMVQGKINGTKEYPTDVDYKKPTNINNLTDSDKLTDSQNQFLNFTTGASLNNDANDDLGTWNFGNLNFYEDQDGIKTIKISLLVTNLSNYPVKATLTYSNSYDNITVTANKLESYLAKYDQSKNADANQSLLTNDEFVVELKVTDDSKNANASNFSMNIKVEKYSDPDATLDKLTLTYNGTLYNAYSSLEQYGVIGKTSPQGLTDYYVAEIKQDATGEVVIPAVYNDGEHGDLPVVPGRVNGLVTAIQALGSGKSDAEAMSMVAIPQVTNVILNTGITEVQNLAFAVMPSLVSIQLPSSLMHHQGGTFGASGALTAVSLPYGTEDLKSYSLVDMGMFYANESLVSVGIPSTISRIGDYAFSGCTGLTSVTIPESVTSIGKSSFRECTSLISITTLEGVASIGEYAFWGCSSLTSIKFPEVMTSIGDSAFYDCRSLTTITFPEGVTSIESGVFGSCISLTSIKLPEGVTSIGGHSFGSCTSLKSITIPESVKNIGDFAFSSCTSLESITIPQGVTSVSEGIFNGCTSLKSITIPDGVTSIGSHAFSDCTNLIAITIPENVVSIGQSAFVNCRKITSINIPDGMSSIDYATFSGCSSLESITIPQGVTSIGSNAFYECTNLRTITIPESVEMIGNSAFSRNNNSTIRLISIIVKAVTPPSTNASSRIFGGVVIGQTVMYVPAESVDAYKAADGWKDYTDIIVAIG